MAELHNVALSPHNFRPGPSLYASLAYGFASSATRWFEIPWVPEGRRFASDTPLPVIEDGYVLVPDGPWPRHPRLNVTSGSALSFAICRAILIVISWRRINAAS